jgi:hypothetical protein
MSNIDMDKQIEADYLQHLNSRPRPVPNRTVSSLHGFKSGFDADEQFVYGEDRGDFFLLQREYFDRFQPASPEERFQVDTLIRNEWSLRRLFRAETHLWEYHSMLSNRSSGVPLGEGFHRASEVFMRMQRRVNASEKGYEKAYHELGRLQGMRTSASNPALNFVGAQPQPYQPPLPTPQTESVEAKPPEAAPPPAPPAPQLEPQRTQTEPTTSGLRPNPTLRVSAASVNSAEVTPGLRAAALIDDSHLTRGASSAAPA